MLAEDARKCVFVLVSNVPGELRSADLRAFFSHLVERRAFSCFHFRHRPEHCAPSSVGPTSTTAAHDTSETSGTPGGHTEGRDVSGSSERDASSGPGESEREAPRAVSTCCCVVAVRRGQEAELERRYAGRHWAKPGGALLRRTVKLTRLPVNFDDCEPTTTATAGDVIITSCTSQRRIPWSDLCTLPELNPPSVMPNGNVGTPTAVFLDLIRQCKLPGRVIRKLCLEFPKYRSKRRYGAVSLDYGSGEMAGEEGEREGEGQGEEGGSVDGSDNDRGKTEDEEAIPSDDDHDAEEWERYEALHDDVDKQGRTKERLYEEEMEVVWEKGGSGLVFYTDASHWHNLEGDFDEQCSKEDDWDVDTAPYYDPEGGDKESRDMKTMRQEQSIRDGAKQASVFAGFEQHTKGIGSKVLRRSGWREGSGVGRAADGRAEPVDTEGQHPHNKTGLGYRGEKLIRHWPRSGKRSCRATRDVIISTVYDRPEEEETTVLRSAPPRTIKYRQPGIQFVAGKPLLPHTPAESEPP